MFHSLQLTSMSHNEQMPHHFRTHRQTESFTMLDFVSYRILLLSSDDTVHCRISYYLSSNNQYIFSFHQSLSFKAQSTQYTCS